MNYSEAVEAIQGVTLAGFEFEGGALYGATKTRDLGIAIETSGVSSSSVYGKFGVSIESHRGMKQLGVFETIEEAALFAQDVADEIVVDEFGNLREEVAK